MSTTHPTRRPPVHGIALLLGSLCLLSVAASCRQPRSSREDETVALVRSGRPQAALKLLQDRFAEGRGEAGDRVLLISLLASQGRTPEAVEAFTRAASPGEREPVVLEGILLSSYPPAMRPDPLVMAGIEGGTVRFGTFTSQAVTRAMEKEQDALVPEARLVDLVWLLGAPGTEDHLEQLRSLAEQKKRPAIRFASLGALATIGTERSAQVLGDLAQQFSMSQLMQRNILDAMATNPHAGAVQAAALLDSEYQPVRTRAAGVLARSRQDVTASLLSRSGRIEALAAQVGRGEAPEGSLEKLEEYMTSLDTPLDRSRFIGLLRETAGPAMVPLVCREAVSQETGVAANAIQLLGSLGDPSAAGCLVQAAANPQESVRRAALRALLDIPATDHVDDLTSILKAALDAGDVTTACLALGALGRAGGDVASGILEVQLKSTDEHIRSAAAVALVHMGHDDALGAVERVFQDNKGPWALYSYFEWRLLALHPDQRTRPLVERAVTDGNPSLRDKVLEALADGGEPEAIFLTEKYVLSRLNDPSLEFRNTQEGKVAFLARQVLGGMDEKGDAEGRTKLLRRLLNSDDPYLIAVALRNLEPRDDGWAQERTLELMSTSSDPWLQLEAVRARALLLSAGVSKRP